MGIDAFSACAYPELRYLLDGSHDLFSRVIAEYAPCLEYLTISSTARISPILLIRSTIRCQSYTTSVSCKSTPLGGCNPHTLVIHTARMQVQLLFIVDLADDIAYLVPHLDLSAGIKFSLRLRQSCSLNAELQEVLIASVIKRCRNLTVDPEPQASELLSTHISRRLNFWQHLTIETPCSRIPARVSCRPIFECGHIPRNSSPYFWSTLREINLHLDLRGLLVIGDGPTESSWKSALPGLRNLQWVRFMYATTVKSFVAAPNTVSTPWTKLDFPTIASTYRFRDVNG